MEQELFKNTYRQIHLDQEQKDRIWKCLEAAAGSLSPDGHAHKNVGKRFSFSVRAAICVGVPFVSGMTVFAANEFFLVDRLADAIKLLTQNEQELTAEQQNIYAQYGTALNSEVAGTDGTFRLEAVLYDKNFLFIPFQYSFHPDAPGYENIKAGFTFEQSAMWDSELLAGFRQMQYFSGNVRLLVRCKHLTLAAFAKLTYKYVSLAHCWQKIQHMRLAHLW